MLRVKIANFWMVWFCLLSLLVIAISIKPYKNREIGSTNAVVFNSKSK